MEDDNPPPYEAAPEDEFQPDTLVEPTIFVLAGQSVHVETANSPPAYELSRAVASLTKATEKVTFERFDKIIGATSAAAGAVVPVVKSRRRHLYDLRRTAKQPRIGFSRSRSSTDAPEYYIHSVSRRTIGHVGLRKFSRGGFSAGFTAMPVQIVASQARFAGHQPPLFKLQRKDDRSEWMSSKGDVTVAVEDMADNEHRLIFMRAMPRRDVDALVALWCSRIWQDAAARIETAREDAEGGSFIRKMATGQRIYQGRRYTIS